MKPRLRRTVRLPRAALDLDATIDADLGQDELPHIATVCDFDTALLPRDERDCEDDPVERDCVYAKNLLRRS